MLARNRALDRQQIDERHRKRLSQRLHAQQRRVGRGLLDVGEKSLADLRPLGEIAARPAARLASGPHVGGQHIEDRVLVAQSSANTNS